MKRTDFRPNDNKITTISNKDKKLIRDTKNLDRNYQASDKQIFSSQQNVEHTTTKSDYESRVQAYEKQGMTRSDAQGVVDAEDMNKNKVNETKKDNGKIKIMYNGEIIERKIRAEQMGNFQMNIVRINNKDYLLGDGAEYLQGYDDTYDFTELRPLESKRSYSKRKYRF